MPSDESKFYRRVFATNHRRELNKQIYRCLPSLVGRVLIIGAGRMDYSKFFDETKCSLTQTDIISCGPHIDHTIDILELHKLQKKYDVIIALEVLEHVESLIAAIDQVYDSLDEGGKFIASLPFMFHIHGDPRDYIRLTEQGINKYLGRFKLVHIHAFGSRFHVILDLISTSFKALAVIRIFNYFFSSKFFSHTSKTAPSGYFFECHK